VEHLQICKVPICVIQVVEAATGQVKQTLAGVSHSVLLNAISCTVLQNYIVDFRLPVQSEYLALCLTIIILQDTEPITALAFGSTADTLYSASRSLQISSWDIPSGLCKKTWKVGYSLLHTNFDAYICITHGPIG